ncbi:MAG: hypothetical protein DWQ07_06570 [Chloroflexi bacterium]|nr:MAG: hypothetical protein DWQ07_06570 [Chloroflexota bacterium]MBL1195906.1 hypothetical protein [Chloroflexota bacterium]NOH13198.1 hypothetical protein [Chloroflexota bacterium]
MNGFSPFVYKRMFTAAVSLLLVGLACAPLDFAGRELDEASDTYYVEVVGNDDNDCLSAETACYSITGALLKADDLDLILIGEGLFNYEPSESPFVSLIVTESVELRGSGATSTIIDGNGNTTVVLVDGATVAINDLQITNGGAFDASSGEGGGVRVTEDAILSMRNVAVDFNQSFSAGGAISNNGSLKIEFSQIRHNRVDASSEGADGMNGGAIYNTGDLRLTNVLLNGNSANEGGGIFNALGASMIAENVSMGVNRAFNGGAIFNEGEATIRYATILNNEAVIDTVDGIYSASDNDTTHLELLNVTISGHDQVGLFLRSSSDIAYTTIARNGTGLHLVSFGFDQELRNVIIAENGGRDCIFEGGIGSRSAIFRGKNLNSDGSCELSEDGPMETGNADLLELEEFRFPFFPNRVHPLGPESEARDFAIGACPEDDQRFALRPAGAACDVGAYEAPISGLSLDDEELVFVTVTPTPTLDPQQPGTLIIIVDTPCYSGPGDRWDYVQTLPEGTEAEVVGYAFGGGWYVARNPDNPNVNCWLDEEDVDPNVPIGDLRLISVPPTPTPQPSATPDDPRQSGNPTEPACVPSPQFPCP